MKRIAFVVSAWLPIAVAGLVVAAPADPGVSIQVFKFRPVRLEVKAGRLGGKGASGSVQFEQAGVFPFFCERHPAMFGEVHVTQ